MDIFNEINKIFNEAGEQYAPQRKYVYRHKKTGLEYTMLELEAQFRLNFKTYKDFDAWIDREFDEIIVYKGANKNG